MLALLWGDQGVGKPQAPREVQQPTRLARLERTDDLDPDPLALLEKLAPLDERGEEQVRKRAVLEQQPPEDFAVDRDVAHRLGHDGGEEDGLSGEEIHLTEEARCTVADDLPAGAVEHRDLALDDRDERIALVADLEQLLADLGGPLLAVLRRAWRAASSRGLDLPARPLDQPNGEGGMRVSPGTSEITSAKSSAKRQHQVWPARASG